jgi:endonuclease III
LDNSSRLQRLVGELKQFYGLLPSPPADAFQMFVWEVLSYQSSPQQRNSAVAALKRSLSLTPDAMSKVAPKKLEDSVKLTGSYVEQRLRALKSGVTIFQRNPDLPAAIKGPIAEAQQALATLPQMGDGSADRMLLYAGDRLVFPLEAGVGRLIRRLGYDDAPASEVPATLDAYRRASTYLAHHAVATCTEKDPHCTVCPLRPDCPYAQER